jgi:hypothetical protein
MFDRTTIQAGPSYTTVTENRAPTDQSVRLLREMEAKAREQVEKSMKLPSNELNGVIHFSYDMMSCCKKAAVFYNLNGNQHRVDVILDDFIDDTRDKKINKMIKAVSDDFAVRVLRKSWTVDVMKEIDRK